MVPLQHTVPCVTDDENSDDEEDDWDNEINRPIQPRYNLRMRATNIANSIILKKHQMYKAVTQHQYTKGDIALQQNYCR
eukprot:15360455-Ditylum_brightwellii.AAC.1